MTATAAAQTDSAPEPSINIINDAPSAQQRTGNGVVANGSTVRLPFGAPFTTATAAAMGRRRPATERKRQAEVFANSCYEMLLILREQMGLNQPKPSQNSHIATPQAPGQSADGQLSGKNGEASCESDSRQSARAELKEAAGILVNLTRGWDTALERSRVERGVPDPGCRRPGEPIPKARKPVNRAPDSLASH